jgi:hypothetical protein
MTWKMDAIKYRSHGFGGDSNGAIALLTSQNNGPFIRPTVMLVSNSTNNISDALNDLRFWDECSPGFLSASGCTTRGFLDAYQSQWAGHGSLNQWIRSESGNFSIGAGKVNMVVGGHSMGGALASLNYIGILDGLDNGDNLFDNNTIEIDHLRLVTFGAPKAVDKTLRESGLALHPTRAWQPHIVVHETWTPTGGAKDVVPDLPIGKFVHMNDDIQVIRSSKTTYGRRMRASGASFFTRIKSALPITSRWFAHVRGGYLFACNDEDWRTIIENNSETVFFGDGKQPAVAGWWPVQDRLWKMNYK